MVIWKWFIKFELGETEEHCPKEKMKKKKKKKIELGKTKKKNQKKKKKKKKKKKWMGSFLKVLTKIFFLVKKLFLVRKVKFSKSRWKLST